VAFVAQIQPAQILELATHGMSSIHQAISAAIATGTRMRLWLEQQRKSSMTAMHTLAKQIIMIGHTPEKDGQSLAETASCLLQKIWEEEECLQKEEVANIRALCKRKHQAMFLFEEEDLMEEMALSSGKETTVSK